MTPRDIEIRTVDGFVLRGTLYEGGSDEAMLVASAMGVKRRYYDAFARFAAARGISVVTFDYRGIGDSRPRSLRGFDATMDQWGQLDIAAAIEWISRELRPSSLLYVGHSAGGQVAGLAPNIQRVSRFGLIASQSGHWRHWPGASRYGISALWIVMPLVARLVGYFPAKLLGLGSEDLPRDVASQWARWGRDRRYLFRDHDEALYANISAPIVAWSFSDDRYAPKRAVDALLARYSGAAITRLHTEERGFGHFDFFRRKGEAKWEELLRLLAPDRHTPLATAAASLPAGQVIL
jgi:predicted alpha/beta hydrolase